jgi:Trk-type K+ transport system membrane component
MKLNSKYTIGASYIGYTTQALAINFAPLLFITFENSYGLDLSKISLLIAISFISQLSVDAFEARFSHHFNTRVSIIIGHLCVAFGLISYAILPEILPSAFLGLSVATVLCGIGGAIIEVLISPIVEACPTKNKARAMSLLHSFYCWGTALTILCASIFFGISGIENWRSLTFLLAIIPTLGAVMFSVVPIYSLPADSEEGKQISKDKKLSHSPLFWAFVAIMFCAGASEMSMIQWASSFAEAELGIDKAMGDILGPFAFAIFIAMIVFMNHNNIGIEKILFDCISAISNTGFSLADPSELNSVGSSILIVLMYIGRIGPLSLVLAFVHKDNRQKFVEYPEEKVIL